MKLEFLKESGHTYRMNEPNKEEEPSLMKACAHEHWWCSYVSAMCAKEDSCWSETKHMAQDTVIYRAHEQHKRKQNCIGVIVDEQIIIHDLTFLTAFLGNPETEDRFVVESILE